MKTTKIEVRQEKGAKPIDVDFRLPETLEEASKVYGADVAYSLFKSALVVAAQGFIRGKLMGKKPLKAGSKELQDAVHGWKPGVRAGGANKVEKMKEKLSGLSAEALAELGLSPEQIKKLKASAQKKAA